MAPLTMDCDETVNLLKNGPYRAGTWQYQGQWLRIRAVQPPVGHNLPRAYYGGSDHWVYGANVVDGYLEVICLPRAREYTLTPDERRGRRSDCPVHQIE